MTPNQLNVVKLRAIIELMDLSIADISRVLGCYSRPMISRVINENLECHGLWAELERKLPEIISKRRRSYFQVEAVTIERVQAVMNTVRNVA